jgi:hypothetical protein
MHMTMSTVGLPVRNALIMPSWLPIPPRDPMPPPPPGPPPPSIVYCLELIIREIEKRGFV